MDKLHKLSQYALKKHHSDNIYTMLLKEEEELVKKLSRTRIQKIESLKKAKEAEEKMKEVTQDNNPSVYCGYTSCKHNRGQNALRDKCEYDGKVDLIYDTETELLKCANFCNEPQRFHAFEQEDQRCYEGE